MTETLTAQDKRDDDAPCKHKVQKIVSVNRYRTDEADSGPHYEYREVTVTKYKCAACGHEWERQSSRDYAEIEYPATPSRPKPPQKPTDFEKINSRQVYVGVFLSWLMGALFVLAGIMIPVGRIRSINRIYDYKPVEIRQLMIRNSLPRSTIEIILFGGMGLLLIGFGVLALRHHRKARGLRVSTTREGLLRVQGHRSKLIRWDAIKTVHAAVILPKVSGIRLPASYIYTITCKNGQEYIFDSSLKNIYALGERIQREVAQRKLPQALDTLQQGAALTFGPFSITATRLTARGGIAWDQIKQISVYRGWVTVQGRANIVGRASPGVYTFASVRLQKIPNLGLFLALARHYGVRVTVTAP